jgi:single stranded DNA-binding protein
MNRLKPIQPRAEGEIMASLNKVLLIGQVTPEGVKFGYNENNTSEAIWTIVVEEPGAQGAMFKIFIPCVAYSKTAEAIVETLQAGQTVFLEGRLKFRSWMTKTGDKKSRLEVVTWMVQPLGTSASTTTAA